VITDGLWLIGAGGHAKVVVATLEAAGTVIAGVFDADPKKAGTLILGRHIDRMPDRDWWSVEPRSALLAVGSNEQRAELARQLPARWATIIHPTAIVHHTASLGRGTVVCAGAIIQPEARIGSHVIVNAGAIIEHDCRIGDFSHLAPGGCCAGTVTLGTGVFLGARAVVIPDLEVGDRSIVGAGAVVIRSIPSDTVVAGVPARSISTHRE
jgi:sugar O-acyltransferase (sialic acid O-acetyltransferase NeuD family)